LREARAEYDARLGRLESSDEWGGVLGRVERTGRKMPLTGPWKEGDRVVLDRDAAEHWLKKGDIGEVVHRHEGGGAFKVRFDLASGATAAVLTLKVPEIRSVP